MTVTLLLAVADVMAACRVGRDEAYQLMRAAGAIRLGRGGALHVRPDDLDEHLRRLRDREADE
jgi:hypothetical protein